MLNTRKSISALRWNPENDAELACAFTHWSEVFVYRLDTWSDKPARVLQVGHQGRASAGGNLSLLFMKPQPKHPPVVVAGSAYGVLRCWRQERPRQVTWEVKARGNGGKPSP
jgi:hypothetical protein